MRLPDVVAWMNRTGIDEEFSLWTSKKEAVVVKRKNDFLILAMRWRDGGYGPLSTVRISRPHLQHWLVKLKLSECASQEDALRLFKRVAADPAVTIDLGDCAASRKPSTPTSLHPVSVAEWIRARGIDEEFIAWKSQDTENSMHIVRAGDYVLLTAVNAAGQKVAACTGRFAPGRAAYAVQTLRLYPCSSNEQLLRVRDLFDEAEETAWDSDLSTS